MTPKLPTSQDALLFTPGPLTTSLAVKQAMLHDAGSWHWEFNNLVAEVRQALLGLGGVSRESGWEAILMQGSGTFGVEAVFQSAIPPEGKVAARDLCIENANNGLRRPVQVMEGNYNLMPGACPWWDSVQGKQR